MRQIVDVSHSRSASARFAAISSGRSFQLALLTIATAASAYGRSAVSPMQETLRIALHLTDNQIALLQGSALALPLVVGAVPMGLLIDRRIRVRLLLLFASLNALGSFLTAAATVFPVLFIARCLVGLTATATLAAVASLVADFYPPTQRGRASTVTSIGQVAGASAAFALGGVLLSMSDSGGTEHWRWALSWLSAPMLLVAAMALAMREPPRRERAIRNPTTLQAFIELWQHRRVILPLAAGVVMVAIADCAALIWTAPTLARRFALAPDRIGAIMSITLLVSGVLGAIGGGVLSDLCQRGGGPRRTLFALGLLAFVSIPASLFAVMPQLVLVGLLVLFMVIGSVIGVSATTLSTVVIPNELRGLCLSVLFAAGAIFGIGLAPMMVSILSTTLGGPQLIGTALSAVCVTTSIIGAVAFLFGSHNLRESRNG